MSARTPNTISRAVLAELRGAGLSKAQWSRIQGFAYGVWGGDRCGCSDDRCIGFHHETESDCGCFPVLFDAWAESTRQEITT